jgi:hypothetical protein
VVLPLEYAGVFSGLTTIRRRAYVVSSGMHTVYRGQTTVCMVMHWYAYVPAAPAGEARRGEAGMVGRAYTLGLCVQCLITFAYGKISILLENDDRDHGNR